MSEQPQILVIDDEPYFLIAAERLLGKEGYHITTAATAQDGLRLTKALIPDLVLLDRMLPDGDGVDICRQIKGNPLTARVLVALMSGFKTAGEDFADGLETGADAYFTRPIGNRHLLAQVATLMRIKRAEQKVDHLHQALRAITNVNQFIAREKDRDRMLQRSCDLLVETRGYQRVWILLLTPDGKLDLAVQSSSDSAESSLLDQFETLSELPECGRRAMAQNNVVVSDDPSVCPLLRNHEGYSSITARMESGNRIFGIMCASIPANLADDEEEHFLLREVAEDIAFALYDNELMLQHKLADDALLESERKLTTLMGNLPGMAYRCANTRDWPMEFVSEGCLALTGYATSELSGNESLPFGELIHPEDRASVWETVQRAVRDDRPYLI